MYSSHKKMKEILVFFTRQKVLCVLCLLSIFVIVKYSKLPTPDWLPISICSLLNRPDEGTTDFEIWTLLNSLSLAFVSSVITYIIIHYIPERRKVHKAFAIQKKQLCSLYSYMSRLIYMYLFEIGIKDTERNITEKRISNVCNVEITDQWRYCKIRTFRNGKNGNVVDLGYNLFKDSKQYSELIQKTIDQMKGTVFSAYLDQDILEMLSIIENNWFLKYFSYMDTPYKRTPGYQNVILNYDKSFFELIKCHISLDKYDYDKLTYEFSEISEDEIKAEEEKRLFMASRVIYKHFGASEAIRIANEITALEPNEERLRKANGVLLELLVFYDTEEQKQKEILDAAFTIAEYILVNENNLQDKEIAFLNVMQIKKRLQIITAEDINKLDAIIVDGKGSEEVLIGALIICEKYKEAVPLFEQLSEERKRIFTQLPIYRLWEKPPVEPNRDPMVFID